MSLGERIKEQRKSCGMSQEKVAELVGVSRQAVTKWETGQSAPSTENLFKLAEIFGTTVDILLASDKEQKGSPAEQIYYLYKMEEEKKAENLRARRKKNYLFTLTVLGGYILVYLAGRILRTTGGPTSVIGWLFGTDPNQLSYLYGWLLHQKIFLLAMAASAVTALFGKRCFSSMTLFGFTAGLLLGELCGYNPAGATYGHDHYGWAIWGGIFAFSLVMGAILEKLTKDKLNLKSKKLWIWSAILTIGILAIVVAVKANMPTSFG